VLQTAVAHVWGVTRTQVGQHVWRLSWGTTSVGQLANCISLQAEALHAGAGRQVGQTVLFLFNDKEVPLALAQVGVEDSRQLLVVVVLPPLLPPVVAFLFEQFVGKQDMQQVAWSSTGVT